MLLSENFSVADEGKADCEPTCSTTELFSRSVPVHVLLPLNKTLPPDIYSGDVCEVPEIDPEMVSNPVLDVMRGLWLVP